VASLTSNLRPFRRAILKALAAGAALLVAAGPAMAQAAAERTLNIAYRINWGVINVGSISLDLRATQVGYSVAARTRMSETLRNLAPRAAASADYTARVSGRIGAQGLQPGTYSHRGGRKGRVVTVTFSTPQVGVSVVPAFGSMGNPPATPAQRRESIDALSAFASMILASSNPCGRTLRVFDGRARYNLALSGGTSERITTPAFTGQAIRCNTRYDQIAGFEADDDPPFRGAISIWVVRQANGLYAPVRIRGDSVAGQVSIDAVRVTAGGSAVS